MTIHYSIVGETITKYPVSATLNGKSFTVTYSDNSEAVYAWTGEGSYGAGYVSFYNGHNFHYSESGYTVSFYVGGASQ